MCARSQCLYNYIIPDKTNRSKWIKLWDLCVVIKSKLSIIGKRIWTTLFNMPTKKSINYSGVGRCLNKCMLRSTLRLANFKVPTQNSNGCTSTRTSQYTHRQKWWSDVMVDIGMLYILLSWGCSVYNIHHDLSMMIPSWRRKLFSQLSSFIHLGIPCLLVNRCLAE